MKYEITKNTKTIDNITLYQIKALIDIPRHNVKEKDLGGWIEKKENLSQERDAWISENACVFNNAMVYEDAYVYDNARAYGHCQIFGNSRVFENAEIFGDARVGEKAQVYRDAKIGGIALIYGIAHYTWSCDLDIQHYRKKFPRIEF